MRNDDEDNYEDDTEWVIIDWRKLTLESETETTRLVKSVNYDLLRGRLIKAALFRSSFGCPECGDSRDVCPGCGAFSRRQV
jgi:hypothetical protein